MAKRLNKKMVVGLTITGMVVTTVAGFAMLATLPSKNPRVFVDQAKQFEASGDHRRSAQAYRQAWVRAKHGESEGDPNDFLIKAGDVALKGGYAAEALAAWGDVMVDDPQNAEAQRRVVELYFELATLSGSGSGMWQRVRQEAEKLKGIAGHENDYAALHALGRALVEQRRVDERNLEEGLKYLRTAVEGDKSNPEYAESLAQYYLVEEQLDKAEEVYNTLLSDENRSKDAEKLATAYRYRGRFHLRVQLLKADKHRQAKDARASEAELSKLRMEMAEASEKSLADLERAKELAPENVDVLITLGGYWHLRPSQLDDEAERKAEEARFRGTAEGHYKQAIETDKDGYDAYLQLSKLHSDNKEVDKALKVLDERMKRGIQKEHYLGWRNRAYMGMVREEAFRLNLVRAVEAARSEPDGKALDEKMKPIRARLDELYAETRAETEGGEEDPASLFMEGRLLMLDNKNKEAIDVLEKADKLTVGGAQSMQIKRLLANLYVAVGKPGLASELLEMILQVNPSDAAALTKMAQAQLDQGRSELAEQYARKATQLDAANQEAWQARLRANQLMGNMEAVEEILKRLGTEDEASRKLRLAQNRVAEYEESPDPALLAEAEKLLREVLSADPEDIRALRGLVVLLTVQKKEMEEAAKLVAQAQETFKQKLTTAEGDEARQRYENGLKNLEVLDIYTDQNTDEEQKLSRMEQLIRQGKDPFGVAVDLFQLFRQVASRKADAMKALRDAYALRPDDPTVVNTLFREALLEEDWKLSEELVNKAIEKNLDQGEGHFFRGRYRLARSDLEDNFGEAARELRAGLAISPHDSNGQVWLGHALLQLKNYGEAKTAFQEALRINGGNHNATVGLAMVATAQGDAAARQGYLSICAKEVPNHPWVRAQLQRIEEEQNPQEGITRREKIRADAPEDLDNLLQLAGLYVRQGAMDKAGEVYEQARQAGAKELAVAQAYAAYLVTKSPPDAAGAEKLLRETVDAIDASDADKKARAQLVLAQFVMRRVGSEGGPTVEESDAVFVKAAEFSPSLDIEREIGRYFIQTGRSDRAEEWLRKALAAASADGPSESERMTRTLLLEVMVGSGDAGRAGDLQAEIDACQKRWPDDPGYLLFQAEHDVLVGRDDDALAAFGKYIEASPNPSLGLFRRALLRTRRNQWADAVGDLKELKRLSPSFGNYQPRVMLAKAMESGGHAEDAIGELNAILEEQPNHPQAVQELVMLYLRQKPPMTERASRLLAPRLQANPDQPGWLHLMSQVARAAGQADQAVALSLKAAQHSKWNNPLVDVLLDTSLAFNRFDELLAFANETIPKESVDGSVMLNVSLAHAGKGDADQALAWFARAQQDEETQDENTLFAYLSELYAKLGAERLIGAAGKRLAEDPQQLGAKVVLAFAQKQANDESAYERTSREIVEGAAPKTPTELELRQWAVRDLAGFLYVKKRFEESRKIYEKCLEMRPGDFLSLNNLAFLLMEDLGDPAAALRYSSDAYKRVPERFQVLDTYGWNLALTGEFNEGISILDRAVKMAGPTPAPSVLYHLAEAYFRRSESTAAANAQADRREAEALCRKAREGVAEAVKLRGKDPEDILPRIQDLGTRLGLKLD